MVSLRESAVWRSAHAAVLVRLIFIYNVRTTQTERMGFTVRARTRDTRNTSARAEIMIARIARFGQSRAHLLAAQLGRSVDRVLCDVCV